MISEHKQIYTRDKFGLAARSQSHFLMPFTTATFGHVEYNLYFGLSSHCMLNTISVFYCFGLSYHWEDKSTILAIYLHLTAQPSPQINNFKPKSPLLESIGTGTLCQLVNCQMWQAGDLQMASLKGKSFAIDISHCRKLIFPPTLTGYETLTNIPLNPTFFRSPLTCSVPMGTIP